MFCCCLNSSSCIFSFLIFFFFFFFGGGGEGGIILFYSLSIFRHPPLPHKTKCAPPFPFPAPPFACRRQERADSGRPERGPLGTGCSRLLSSAPSSAVSLASSTHQDTAQTCTRQQRQVLLDVHMPLHQQITAPQAAYFPSLIKGDHPRGRNRLSILWLRDDGP